MKYQVALSWIMRALGVGSFIDRVLHVPDDVLETASGLAGVTPAQFRRVEAVQKQIVKQGISVRVPGVEV